MRLCWLRGAALIVLAVALVSCGGAVEETPEPMDAAPAAAPSYTPPVVTPESHDLTLADVERLMEELSNWGRWGTDDQLGAANLITPAKRLEAIALATEGITVSLEHPLLTEEAPAAPPKGGGTDLEEEFARIGAGGGETPSEPEGL